MSELTTKNITYAETISDDAKVICHDGNNVVETQMSNIKAHNNVIKLSVSPTGMPSWKMFQDAGANQNSHTTSFIVLKDSEWKSLVDGNTKVLVYSNPFSDWDNNSRYESGTISASSATIQQGIVDIYNKAFTGMSSSSFSVYVASVYVINTGLTVALASSYPFISASSMRTICNDFTGFNGSTGQQELIIKTLSDNGYFDLDEE